MKLFGFRSYYDVFFAWIEPIRDVKNDNCFVLQDGILEQSDPSVADFEDHAEKICQIATLAAASSTDARSKLTQCFTINLFLFLQTCPLKLNP
jgi:hypothetical protein